MTHNLKDRVGHCLWNIYCCSKSTQKKKNCRHNIIMNIITTDVFCFKCSGFWFHSLVVVVVLLFSLLPTWWCKELWLAFFHPLFISAAVVLLGFLQNWVYKKRAKHSFERSVFCFVCLSVCCKWPLFLGTLCFMSIGLWFAFMSGDILIWWNIKQRILLLIDSAFAWLPPLFFVIYLFLCLCVTQHCRPTDDDNKWGLIC